MSKFSIKMSRCLLKVESLQADNDFTNEQLSNMKGKTFKVMYHNIMTNLSVFQYAENTSCLRLTNMQND